MKKIINYFNGFEWTLIIGMLLANIITGGFAEPIGAICSITGVLCVVLVAKGKLSNFLFGFVNVTLYIFIAWGAKLYGEVMLNTLYYLPVNILGYWIWKRNMNGEEVKAKLLTMKAKIFGSIGCVIAVFAYGCFLSSLGGNTPFLDSTSTVLSIIAQLLMLSMFAEQWILWIVVNIVSVAMWVIPASTGDAAAISMVIMWGAYLINAIYGYINWKKMATK